jgi:hypothetical protein
VQHHLDRTSQLAALKVVMQSHNLRSIKDPQTGLVLNDAQLQQHQRTVARELEGLDKALLATVKELDKLMSDIRPGGKGVVISPKFTPRLDLESNTINNSGAGHDFQLPGHTGATQKGQLPDGPNTSQSIAHPKAPNPLGPDALPGPDLTNERRLTGGTGSLAGNLNNEGVVMRATQDELTNPANTGLNQTAAEERQHSNDHTWQLTEEERQFMDRAFGLHLKAHPQESADGFKEWFDQKVAAWAARPASQHEMSLAEFTARRHGLWGPWLGRSSGLDAKEQQTISAAYDKYRKTTLPAVALNAEAWFNLNVKEWAESFDKGSTTTLADFIAAGGVPKAQPQPTAPPRPKLILP